MNREQRRQAIKAKTRTPAEQQFTALAEYPCILTWSNGERSKTTLSRAFYNEDSYLWVRMYLAGCKFLNLEEDLVFARINQNTFKRRGGYKYYKSERDLFKFMKQNKIITGWEYTKAKFIRFVVQVLMPNGVRQWFFKKFARNKQ